MTSTFWCREVRSIPCPGLKSSFYPLDRGGEVTSTFWRREVWMASFIWSKELGDFWKGSPNCNGLLIVDLSNLGFIVTGKHDRTIGIIWVKFKFLYSYKNYRPGTKCCLKIVCLITVWRTNRQKNKRIGGNITILSYPTKTEEIRN